MTTFSETHTKKPLRIFIFSSILLLAIFSLFLWKYANVMPTGHDSTGHMQTTLGIANAMEDHPLSVYDSLRGQAARYTPLTYLMGASLLLFFDYSHLAFIVEILIFWLLSLLAISASGVKKNGSWLWTSFFCLVGVLAIPTVWTVGMSYNLEASVLAGSAMLLCIFLQAERFHSSLSILAAIFLAGVFGLSKPVLLIPVLPFAFLLCITRDKKLLLKRAAMLIAIVGTAAFWLLTRSDKVLPEMQVDFVNVFETDLPGPFYYPALILFGYRGLPLLAGLGYLLWVRQKRKDLQVEDFALAAFFLAPYIFFSIFDTKREWYPLAGYLAVPVWYAFSANRAWDNLWVRRISKGLLIFFSVLAVFNTVVVLLFSQPSFREGGNFGGLMRSAPPTPMERNLVDRFISIMEEDKSASLAVDATRTGYNAARLKTLFAMLAPKMNSFWQITIADQLLPNKQNFVNAVPRSRWVVTDGEDWPAFVLVNNPDETEKETNRELVRFNERLAGYREQFERGQQFTIGETKLTLFVNASSETMAVVNESVRYYRLSKKAAELKQAGDWAGALLAIGELRKAIEKDQEVGVNLEEAVVLFHLNRFVDAKSLLADNLQRVQQAEPLFAESAFFLARILATEGDAQQAVSVFKKGLASSYDINNMVDGTIFLTRIFRNSRAYDQAAEILDLVQAKTDGEAGSLILVESAKVELCKGDEEKGKALLLKAYQATNDATRREWILDTIEEIGRVGSRNMHFE